MRHRTWASGGWRAAAVLLLAVAALAFARPAASQPVLQITPGMQSATLNGHLALLRDPSGAMTLEQVIAPGQRDRFETLPINLTLGYSPDTAWLRFTLLNAGTQARRLYVEFEPAFVDRIDAFTPATARPAGPADYRETRLGDHVPIAEKPVFSLNNVLPVDLPPGEAREFFVRVQTNSSLVLRGTVRTDRALAERGAEIVLILGLYVGLAFVVGLINLIFWVWVRWSVHFWYAAYVLSLGIVSAATAGVTLVWIFPNHPQWSDLVLGSANALSCTFASYFVIAVLDVRRHSRLLYYVYHGMAIFGLVGLVATFTGHYQLIAGKMFIVALVLLFVAVAQSYRIARQGFAPAQLFLISFAAQLLGLTFNILRVVGVLPTMEWTDYSYQAASAVHMILMNIGLARRMKEAEAVARRAQAEALALAQQAELRAQAIAAERTRDFEAARQRAEDALAAEQEAQRAQVRFIDVISHQYRTPLSVIATNVEGIGMSLGEADGPNRRRIDRIRRAVARLVAMIDVSLDRSRLDGPPLAPQRRLVAPAPMLRQAVQRVRDATGDRIIGLELDDAVDRAVILADPEMIELALINLIENAIKFSHVDRPVDVTGTVQAGALRIAVHDQGIGIPRAELDQVFGKFYRAANASDRPGVGIGLQLVTQLVHAHGGEITVDSTEHEGTSFTISLPLARNHAAA